MNVFDIIGFILKHDYNFIYSDWPLVYWNLSLSQGRPHTQAGLKF